MDATQRQERGAAADRITIRRLSASAYRVPTDRPESDGTIAWDSTTLVVVELEGGGELGLGYTYASAAAAELLNRRARGWVEGQDALDVPGVMVEAARKVRNLGRGGLVAMALSALDSALWDLKAKVLGLSLVDLLGSAREAIEVYGSGGFTSYSPKELREQFEAWARSGIRLGKMKVGTSPEDDPERVAAARAAFLDGGLMVDANGAYSAKQALELADRFAGEGVIWFEEPVSSAQLDQLRLVRQRGPAGMDVAAGEYGDGPEYFRAMLAAEAVDVLQADATRCLGVSGFLQADALCDGFGVPLSAHCAPQLHAHLCCAARRARHLEYFHDHARLERMLFDGALRVEGGKLRPDRSRPGLGIELKRKDAKQFRVQEAS